MNSGTKPKFTKDSFQIDTRDLVEQRRSVIRQKREDNGNVMGFRKSVRADLEMGGDSEYIHVESKLTGQFVRVKQSAILDAQKEDGIGGADLSAQLEENARAVEEASIVSIGGVCLYCVYKDHNTIFIRGVIAYHS